MVPAKQNWEEIARLVREGRVDELGRLKEDLEVYRRHNERLQLEWKTVGDYILHREFGWEWKWDETGRRKEVDREKQKKHKNGDMDVYTFAKNDFPYAIEDGIEHHIIWSLDAISSERLAQIVVKERDPKLYESVYWVNPENLRSVRNVHHVHIFSRKRAPQ